MAGCNSRSDSFDPKAVLSSEDAARCLLSEGDYRYSETEYKNQCQGRPVSIDVFIKELVDFNEYEASRGGKVFTIKTQPHREAWYKGSFVKINGVLNRRAASGRAVIGNAHIISIDRPDDQIWLKRIADEDGPYINIGTNFYPPPVTKVISVSKMPSEDAGVIRNPPSADELTNQRMEARAKDNQRMMQYAEHNHEKLAKQAISIRVDPNFSTWSSATHYTMPDGSIVTCMRGMLGDTFMYSCQ